MLLARTIVWTLAAGLILSGATQIARRVDALLFSAPDGSPRLAGSAVGHALSHTMARDGRSQPPPPATAQDG